MRTSPILFLAVLIAGCGAATNVQVMKPVTAKSNPFSRLKLQKSAATTF